MALPIDVFRNVAKAIPQAAQKVTGNTGTTTPAPNSITQGVNGFSWVDPSTGKTVTINPANKGGYMTAYGNHVQKMNAIADKHKADLQAGLATNNTNTNANFDSSQRQAYVDYMRKQKALPSQLQALGVNGGATESGLLNLYNNYGIEHASNEQQRAAELAANQRNFDDAWNAYWENLQTDLADKEQTAINNQLNEYKNDLTTFQQFVAQYPTTEKGYEKYQEWIKKLQAGNDPLKDYKIAAVRTQMATQFPDGKPKGGGSSSGGGGGGGSRRSGSGSRSGGYSSGGGGNSTPEKTETKNQGNSVGSYYSTGSGKSKSKTKSIKGDTYRVTRKGSYRSR